MKRYVKLDQTLLKNYCATFNLKPAFASKDDNKIALTEDTKSK